MRRERILAWREVDAVDVTVQPPPDACRTQGHEPVEITEMGDPEPSYICTRCSAVLLPEEV